MTVEPCLQICITGYCVNDIIVSEKLDRPKSIIKLETFNKFKLWWKLVPTRTELNLTQ